MTTKEEAEALLEMIRSRPDYDFEKDPDNLLNGANVFILNDEFYPLGKEIKTTRDKEFEK